MRRFILHDMKQVIIIAGPNGAGKTTFANDFLPNEGGTINFLNADLIAYGLSPFAPEKAVDERKIWDTSQGKPEFVDES